MIYSAEFHDVSHNNNHIKLAEIENNETVMILQGLFFTLTSIGS